MNIESISQQPALIAQRARLESSNSGVEKLDGSISQSHHSQLRTLVLQINTTYTKEMNKLLHLGYSSQSTPRRGIVAGVKDVHPCYKLKLK